MQESWRPSILYSDWSGSNETLRTYWRVYGGVSALIRSPALIFATVVGTICYPLWWLNTSASLAISIVPNLLGFSIGAMAVVLAFPTTEIFDLIAEDGREDSYYLDLITKFVHFIFVQVVALVFALLATAFPIFIFSYLTLIILLYAVASGAMAALALFEVAIFYNANANSNGTNQSNVQSEKQQNKKISSKE